MRIFAMEHSRLAYGADFVLYAGSVLAMLAFLLMSGPLAEQWPGIAGFTVLGLASWSAIEYALHRFVLHGLQPFRRWHEDHHRRPQALICTPTVLSGTLIAGLVFLPALLLGDLWRACGLTLGLLIGYLGYAVTHHAIHHWHADHGWLRRRQRWHARHHHLGRPGCYGVSSAFWDHLLDSICQPGAPRPHPKPSPHQEP